MRNNIIKNYRLHDQLVSTIDIRPHRAVKLLEENNKRLRYLSKEECLSLINACNPHLKPTVLTALNTGMRKGEILSLKWDNVDLKHGFIKLDKTKNGERREIPITDNLRIMFQSLTRRIDIPLLYSLTMLQAALIEMLRGVSIHH